MTSGWMWPSGYRTSNPHFTHWPGGQVLDVLDALLQLIEDRARACEQRISVHGRLDAARAAVEKSRAQLVFEIGNHLRHGRLGNSQLCGGLGHAPVLDDCEKHVQIPQSQTAADLTVGIEFSGIGKSR